MKRERTTLVRATSRFPKLHSDSDWGGRATRAEVNLDAIASNIRHIVRHVSPAEVMAVVKADAYGHGAVAVGTTALAHGVRWLAVYTTAEGATLRRNGVTAPILVFGPFTRGEANDIWAYDLTPTLANLDGAAHLQERAAGRVLGFHLKLDTGLARAGIAPHDAVSLLRTVAQSYPALRHEGTYTHFASADEPDKSTTLDQIQCFGTAVEHMEREGFTSSVNHAANSAALLDLPAGRFDIVRAGIAMYGYYPSASTSRTVSLLPALQLVSGVSRVHRIPPGAGVGYGHDFRATRATTIALIPIGYGDGLPRVLGHGRGGVLLRSQWAPIVGRVSMDQITVDATDIPGVRPGDPVVVIGVDGNLEQGADDVAGQAGTISYEIVTGLLPRVPRVYVEHGALITAESRGRRTYPLRATAATQDPVS